MVKNVLASECAKPAVRRPNQYDSRLGQKIIEQSPKKGGGRLPVPFEAQ